MADYIEREAALAAIRERCAPCGEGIEALKSVTAADVAPVAHGFWEEGNFCDMGDVCSVCQFDSGADDCTWDYCPNCGCRMDLEYAHD